MAIRSVWVDTRVGNKRPDAEFWHPATRNADKFRHRAIARIWDNQNLKDFSIEESYNGQMFWIEDLYENLMKHPSSKNWKYQAFLRGSTLKPLYQFQNAKKRRYWRGPVYNSSGVARTQHMLHNCQCRTVLRTISRLATPT